MRIVVWLLVVAIGIGAFYGGRASKDERPAAVGGFAAGREAAFNGFDGGWTYGQPYIVVLRRGGPGVTYQFASRRPLLAGRDYRRCGNAICARRVH